MNARPILHPCFRVILNESGIPRNRSEAKHPYKIFCPPGRMCWTQYENIGHSSKNLGPSWKTLHPSLCPKLVTGLPRTRVARWPVFHRPGPYFTANLAEAGKRLVFWYFNRCPKPAFWKWMICSGVTNGWGG